ncbi:MAG: addiction module protein [Terriglobales bacterium]
MNLPDAPIAHEGFFATHFFTVSDQDKSKDFYVRILGGKVIKPDNPCYIKLANTWIILNSGGGLTPDKPEVLLETPPDLNRMNSFLNLRVGGWPTQARFWLEWVSSRRKMGWMTREVTELLKKALALPPEARAALAGSLLESLDETVDATAEQEWGREIARRIEELDSGTVKPIPWEEARRQI